jgi:hypothetical protein
MVRNRGDLVSSQLLGVLIGGLIGLAGATLTPWLAGRRDRWRARAFVRAYLVSILEIAESRGHLARAKAMLERWKAGDTDASLITYGSQSDSVGDPIANGDLLKQTAFLNPVDAADLARFIGSLRAVRIDLDASSTEPVKTAPMQKRIAALEWTIAEWTKAEAIASRLIARLGKYQCATPVHWVKGDAQHFQISG